MRPNRTQQHICDFLIEQLTWWRDSNDINSPTHYSDLSSRLDDLVEDEGWITEIQAQNIEAWATNLLIEIRHLKED